MTGIPQTEMQPAVYRKQRWRRVCLYLGAPFFLLGSVGLLMAASQAPPAKAPLAYSFALLVLAFSFYMIASAVRPRIVLDARSIAVRGVFRERCADRSEIEGLRTAASRYGSYKQLVLKDGRKPIAVRSRFKTDDDFRAWFQDLPDLDKRDREALLARIAQQQDLGSTAEERLAALARAKQYNIALMGIAVAAAVGLNFTAAPWMEVSAVVLVLIPLLDAWLCWRSPLLYTAFRKKQDPRAETIHGLLIAGLGMFFHLAPFHFLSRLPLIGGMAVLGLITLAVYYQAVRDGTGNKALIAAVLLAALYAYGTMTTLDVCFDSSNGTHSSTSVIGKHVARGRSTSYYLRLAPWGPVSAAQNVSVSARLYRATSVGDTVCLDLHPGWLRVPWFRVGACAAPDFSASRAPAN